MDKRQPQSEAQGNIGEQIFTQVERLTAEGSISRSDAFNRIAEETGRRAGTVAADYYRIARREGASPAPRKRRAKKAEGAPRLPRTESNTSAALARARESIAELGAIAKAQKKELAALRAQAARLDTIRNALKSL